MVVDVLMIPFPLPLGGKEDCACVHLRVCMHAHLFLFNLQWLLPVWDFNYFLLDFCCCLCFEFFKSALPLLNVSCMFLLSPDFLGTGLFFAEAGSHYHSCSSVLQAFLSSKEWNYKQYKCVVSFKISLSILEKDSCVKFYDQI